MILDYEYKRYENFDELRNDDPKLAKGILKQVLEGEWMENELYVYPDDWEFAKYELKDGWYCNCNFKDDYNGAPNPFDHIDMDSFARALIRTWDESCNMEVGEQIVTTGYGW